MELREKVFPLIIVGLTLAFLVPVVVIGVFRAARGSWMTRGRMMWPGMMSWSGYGFGSMHSPWPSLLFIIFLGFVVFGIYYIISGCCVNTRTEDRSLEILRERFAKGEISEEQFRKMQEELHR